MPLPWVRLDTNLPSHDKILGLLEERDGFRTALVYVFGLSYCGANETDGLIPFAAIGLIHGRKKDAEALVKHGLWKPVPRGWEVHNWLNRQQASQVTDATKQANRLGALKANCIRWHGPECGCWKAAVIA